MASGPEHYAKAEELLGSWRDFELDDPAETLAAAQVHATLALAAATASRTIQDYESGSGMDWKQIQGGQWITALAPTDTDTDTN